MKIERTKNTISGTICGIMLKLMTLIFPFIIRTIFIRLLGAEYLGLNSLFSSVLQVLNLAELGVGSALVFSMYKPIIDDDSTKINALMKLYRTYYRIIGLVILILGLILIPFLHLFIKGDVPQDINIYIIYLMQLAATVLSYWLFSYRNCLFQAFQRTDITSLIAIVINLFLYASQIGALLFWKNYYVYLLIGIIFQVVSNIVTAILSKRFFPDYVPSGSLEEQEVKDINRRVRDLFTAKFGNVVTQSFDALVISTFLGLTTLAVYQNYYYILSAVYALIMVLFSSSQAGIGNYLLTHDEKDNRDLFYVFNYVTAFIAAIGSCCFLNLYQPFIYLWAGQDYLLDFSYVILLVIYFYAYLILRPYCVFKDSAGMWRQDRFRPLTAATTNLVLSVILVQKCGLFGVIAATIFVILFISLPWLISNINKNMFTLHPKELILKEISYVFVTVICCAVTYYAVAATNCKNNVIDLLVRLDISIVIPLAIFGICFWGTKECKYVIKHGKSMLKGRM